VEAGAGRAVNVLLYPLCFAVARVLAIAADNPGQYRPSDLAIVLLVVSLATGLAIAATLAAVKVIERTERAAPLAAAVAMLGVAWFFFYEPAHMALNEVSPAIGRHRVLVPLGAVATLGALAWLWRQPHERLLGVGTFMTRCGLLLLVTVAAQAAISEGRGPWAARQSSLARELAAPLRTVPALAPSRNTPPRDIYVLVLDGHANARVLEEVFGFDNSRFEDSLRALGFQVPRDMRSNYVQTYLSVSSLLNFSQLTKLTKDLGAASTSHAVPTYLVKYNRAARFLKSRGYRYVLFPSAWWAATATSPLADVEFDPHAAFDLGYELRRTELRLALVRSSLLRFAVQPNLPQVSMTQQFLRSFEGLRKVPSIPAPTFTFAHLLLPHIPYILDAGCRPLDQAISDDMEADTPAQRAAYIAQVRCADRLVLELVTTLLRQSPRPPVILIVGDHGPRFADIGFYGHPERVSTAFVRERFGAFGAFYLPAGGERAFHEPVTLVNVLGNVVRYYFGAAVPPSGDEMYMSGQELYRFYRVDPRLLERGALPAPERAP
jgi:sulfatase-like protein